MKIKQNLGEKNNPKSKGDIFIVKIESKREAGNHHTQSGREVRTSSKIIAWMTFKFKTMKFEGLNFTKVWVFTEEIMYHTAKKIFWTICY